MIQYTLRCDQGHQFDSWFQSAAAFETLKAGGHVACAVCGSGQVDKAMMAPRVTPSRRKAAAASEAPKTRADDAPVPVASAPDPRLRAALDEMRRQVEANSDYVGDAFAREARAMHLGEAPERSIYGEARPEEARALLDDGVPVLPLPFRPTRKTN